MRDKKKTQLILENTYNKFHYRKFVKPDPLQFLYDYPQIRDREIAGLVASTLALGRVNSIIKIINYVLSRIPEPYENLMALTEQELSSLFEGFKYRFYSREDLVDLLLAVQRTVKSFGSLNNCFCAGYKESDKTVVPALNHLVETLNLRCKLKMIADPSKNSACKRLHLYLRWMIRTDDIDPGGWTGIPKSKLLIPLDTHIYKVSKMLRLTNRNDSGIKTAIEITENLKLFDREDPVRFDFSITRPGIHPELGYEEFK